MPRPAVLVCFSPEKAKLLRIALSNCAIDGANVYVDSETQPFWRF